MGVTHPVKHHLDGKTDKRYTVTLEWCGYPVKRFIARFCGAWIGQSEIEAEALILAQEHYDNHKIDAVYKS